MAYDYFINAQWKIYGCDNVRDSDGNLVTDHTITNSMVIAS